MAAMPAVQTPIFDIQLDNHWIALAWVHRVLLIYFLD